MIELGDEHRRHAVEGRAPLAVDRPQRGLGVERFGGKYHRGAVRDGGELAHHAAEAVIERHGHADAVLVRVTERLADEKPVVQDVVVRQRRPFRRPGRAEVYWMLTGSSNCSCASRAVKSAADTLSAR